MIGRNGDIVLLRCVCNNVFQCFFLFLSSFVKKENNDEDLVVELYCEDDLHRHHVLPAGMTVSRLLQEVKVIFMLFIATAEGHDMM